MNRYGYLASITVLLLCNPVRFMLAQSMSVDETKSSATSDVAKPHAAAEDLSPNDREEGKEQYAAALDGSGLISISNDTPSRYIFGATLGGGIDSNPDNRSGSAATALYTVSPYVGIQANTAKIRSLFQYQFTSTAFSADYAKQSRHVASIGILGNVNERWSWEFKVTGSYGQDALRFLGTQQTVAVGQIPGIASNSAAYVANAGKVASMEGNVEVKYQFTGVDTVKFSVSNALSHYIGQSESNKIATFNLSYGRDISQALGFSIYAQSSSYYGTLHCESYGGGVGVTWRLSNRIAIAASGGPQLNTSSCKSQQGFAYGTSLSTRLTTKSQMYITSERQATSSYLGPGLWQVSTSGGYQRQVRLHGIVNADIGYVSSNTLVAVNSYHGTFFDVAYSHTLATKFNISSGYRAYVGDYGSMHFSRNAILLSCVWTPRAGRIIQ